MFFLYYSATLAASEVKKLYYPDNCVYLISWREYGADISLHINNKYYDYPWMYG